jgi:hypothetical protein
MRKAASSLASIGDRLRGLLLTTAGCTRSPKPRPAGRDPGAARSPDTTPMRM